MDTALWIGQIFLAGTFLYSGICKSIFSERVLVEQRGQTGVEGLPPGFIRFIGIMEVLGAAGIILPWWLGIGPWLTPAAAACFGLIMLPALVIHYRRMARSPKELKNILTNVLVLTVSVFVLWGRS